MTRRVARGRSGGQATPVADVDPVGVSEIHTRLGVTRTTVDKWRTRDLGFPEPRWTVGGRPAWDWDADIVPWLEATGRAVPTSRRRRSR